MYYTVDHLTKYQYSAPITESVMQLYMQPRTDSALHSTQRCFAFEVSLQPNARVLPYRDFLGNTLHTFTIPGQHTALTISTHAITEVQPIVALPAALETDVWNRLDAEVASSDYWDALQQTPLTQPTALLYELAEALDVQRRADPLTVIRETNSRLYAALEYKPKTTRVDSPIDEALAQRSGVCQDFAQIMLSLLRKLRIPARYVSGYMAHRQGVDRSAADATHAWIEAWLPGLGWIGFDPTNNTITDERHIRVAIGRDYNDVPPTRGVFKGDAHSELSVAVRVTRIDDLNAIPELAMLPLNQLHTSESVSVPDSAAEAQAAQSQQQ